MNLSVAIVGLPNVGKSTLFNTLTRQKVAAENYPFCTIDPNVGIVPVIDERLNQVARIANSKETIEAVVEFYDIAGLVKGAHEGEGLGNAFLSHIRNTAAIVQVIRDFVNTDIIHVESRIDPKSDKEIIEAELILKDLDTIATFINRLEKTARTIQKDKANLDLILLLKQHLESGKFAYTFLEKLPKEEALIRREMQLLTDKPVIYLVNTTDTTKKPRDYVKLFEDVDEEHIIVMDIKQEYEISQLTAEERKDFINDLQLDYVGLEGLVKRAYKILNLISYFTAGEKEARAWTIVNGSKAPEAAGVIHTDFEKKFIAADVVFWKDFIELGGWLGAKEKGKVKLEGKEYIVKDGDVLLFRHGA